MYKNICTHCKIPAACVKSSFCVFHSHLSGLDAFSSIYHCIQAATHYRKNFSFCLCRQMHGFTDSLDSSLLHVLNTLQNTYFNSKPSNKSKTRTVTGPPSQLTSGVCLSVSGFKHTKSRCGEKLASELLTCSLAANCGMDFLKGGVNHYSPQFRKSIPQVAASWQSSSWIRNLPLLDRTTQICPLFWYRSLIQYWIRLAPSLTATRLTVLVNQVCTETVAGLSYLVDHWYQCVVVLVLVLVKLV